MRKRNRIYKKILNATDLQKTKLDREVCLIENSLISSHHDEEIAKDSRAIATIKSNSKYFFSYAKTKSCIKVPTGPLEVSGEII